MRTARLPTVGSSSSEREFEQLYSDDHKMSVVAGGGVGTQVPCPGEEGGYSTTLRNGTSTQTLIFSE